MKPFIAVLLVLAGCTNVTTTKLIRGADGTINISSGKDVKFGSLAYAAPNGEKLEVHDYTSDANTDAINAQAAREKQMFDALIQAVAAGAALAPKP